MGIARCCFLLSCFLLVLVQGLDGPNTEFEQNEIEYVREQVDAAVNATVHLHCGSKAPTIFIWVFSRPGRERNEPLAYNYGQGSRLLGLADSLGDVSLITNSTTLVIQGLSAEAEGVYTCQAMYDTDGSTTVMFYYTQLNLLDEEELIKASAND